MSVRVGIGSARSAAPIPRPTASSGIVEHIEELGFDSIWLSDSATIARAGAARRPRGGRGAHDAA